MNQDDNVLKMINKIKDCYSSSNHMILCCEDKYDFCCENFPEYMIEAIPRESNEFMTTGAHIYIVPMGCDPIRITADE